MSFKINMAVTGFAVGLVSSTDGSDITTGTPVGYITLDGGTQTAIADTTPVHEGNGLWTFDLTAGEMNGAIVALTFTHASAVTQHFTIKTESKLVSDLNDIAATAIVTAGAITTLSGAVVNVDLVDTTTTNTDMRGTDGANTTTPPTAIQNRQEMDANSTQLNKIVNAEILQSATAQGGTANSITLSASTPTIADDLIAHTRIYIVSGTGQYQSRTIDTYNNATKVATLSAGDTWAVTPDATSVYELKEGAAIHVNNLTSAALTGITNELDANSNLSEITAVRLAELDAANLPADIAAVKSDTAATLVDTSTTLDTKINNIQGATFDTLTDSLEAIRNRGDAAWVTGAGGSSPTVTQIRQEMDTNSTQFAAIIADTNELQTDWADGGRLDLIIDAIAQDTAAILIDTNELQGDWTNGGRLDLILDAINSTVSTDGVVLTTAERNAIADAMLDRDMSTGTDSGTSIIRTVRQALRANRNKVSIAGGVMTVTKEDDATTSWTAAITTTAGDPISEVNPAGSA